MSKILSFEIPEDEYKALQMMIEESSNEIRRSHEIMQQDQTEIDQLSKDIEQIRLATEQSKIVSDKVLAELEANYSVFAY